MIKKKRMHLSKSKLVNRERLSILYWLTGFVFILISVGYFAERNAVTEANARMQGTLAFQTETLKTSLEKYTVLAALISRRPDILLALRIINPVDVLPSANQLAVDFIGISGANDIWIVDKEGNILRKNQTEEKTNNIANENYFISAMQGNLGRGNFVAQSGSRLYIIASPVFYENKILGVVVVRLDLEYLEQVLLLLPDPILVVDASQRVLLSSVRQWRLRYFNYALKNNNFSNDSADSVMKRRLARGNDRNSDYLVDSVSRTSINKLKFKTALGENEGRVFLQASLYVPLLEWNVHMFVNYDAIRSQRNNAVFITFLILSLIAMSFFMWQAHQKRRLKEQRSQRAFSLRLERQVRDSNTQLNIEIEERCIVERNLREAQDEFIQAAKLAGIGQMSTALAHEYNQPLTAIRSYADNASIFIKKNKSKNAIENLQRINILVDKMAGLTSTLRRFAHKSMHENEYFSVDSVMDELIILLSPQAKKQNVSLQLLSPVESIELKGEQGKLLQIITNLVTNAMDAVAGCAFQKVKIQWFVEDSKKPDLNSKHVIISIKDTGLGISEKIRKNMFNAFYTTKKTGNGLGLGLFIVSTLLHDFKGTIDLKDNGVDTQGYGTVFELRLPLS
jgi:two-component system C4-dicarboxylate transport sensor histidine kinase DctB